MKNSLWTRFSWINISFYSFGLIVYTLVLIFGSHESSYLAGTILVISVFALFAIGNALSAYSIHKHMKLNQPIPLISKIVIAFSSLGIAAIYITTANSGNGFDKLFHKSDDKSH